MDFEKNTSLEDLITHLNDLLKEPELSQIKNIENARWDYPVFYLIGTPRSGSTLFTQWIASTKAFAYPSNFLSRFYKAPYIGALIYEMVTNDKYQYRDEFVDINEEINFSSSIGKTKGFKAPHEFWYFWRRFFDFPEPPSAGATFLKEFDADTYKKEVLLLQKAFKKPILFKSHIINPYINEFSNLVEQAYFIHLYRDPISTIRSLLKARKKWTGSRGKWFSWKPRKYDKIKDMDVYHQVAGQVYFLEKEILKKRSNLGNKYLSFSYEELCSDPEDIYKKIKDKVDNHLSFKMPEYKIDTKFDISNPKSEDDKFIREAYNFFVEEFGKLEFND